MKKIFLTLLLVGIVGSITAVYQTTSKVAKQMERQGMVNIRSVDPSIHVSLMYSRPDNFCGVILYDDLKEAYLHPLAAKAQP